MISNSTLDLSQVYLNSVRRLVNSNVALNILTWLVLVYNLANVASLLYRYHKQSKGGFVTQRIGTYADLRTHIASTVLSLSLLVNYHFETHSTSHFLVNFATFPLQMTLVIYLVFRTVYHTISPLPVFSQEHVSSKIRFWIQASLPLAFIAVSSVMIIIYKVACDYSPIRMVSPGECSTLADGDEICTPGKTLELSSIQVLLFLLLVQLVSDVWLFVRLITIKVPLEDEVVTSKSKSFAMVILTFLTINIMLSCQICLVFFDLNLVTYSQLLHVTSVMEYWDDMVNMKVLYVFVINVFQFSLMSLLPLVMDLFINKRMKYGFNETSKYTGPKKVRFADV
ncbi:hypothetical protein BABINDRAFT_6174 [Babjeviella inositovora NRRL Y-12698]|uniref:Uncharacterized protein n=1 Tax=Babjeviella inositovora NRRL Y-12698 TaxID=984486 RepID=A0A1E3QWV4_9ASCO|nr:uncharacterized protein BABINDRAFT_6174 [Babjeviella inositovora NRRL Y-12698]ODQ81477.1 hypothetical protein BABINDRAFT_6174 [Babjeviella inositovora NRRL Y-12698]